MRDRVRRVIGAGNNGVKPAGSLANFAQSNDQIYYDNHYNIGPMANLPELAAIPEDPLVVDPTTYEHDNENVYAGYAQYAATVGRWGFLAGVRVEHTDATYNANIQDSSGQHFPQHEQAGLHERLSRLQTANGKRRTTCSSRPRSRPVWHGPASTRSRPRSRYDYVNDIVSQGNPDVKATTANNFDLTSDWHMPTRRCRLRRPVLQIVQQLHHPDGSIGRLPHAASGCGHSFSGVTCQFDSFQNIGSATAKGIELNFVQQFTFLPDFWNGFGVDGNFTYVATRGDIRTGEEHSLPQTSPRNFNAEVFYDKRPSDAAARGLLCLDQPLAGRLRCKPGSLFAGALPSRFRRQLQDHRQCRVVRGREEHHQHEARVHPDARARNIRCSASSTIRTSSSASARTFKARGGGRVSSAVGFSVPETEAQLRKLFGKD